MKEKFVLVIEDDPALGRVAMIALEQFGLRAVLDSDGNQYPQLLEANGMPALILLDLHLPFASGADLLQKFHADERLTGVPVIVMTADLYQARALEEQGTQILIKPIRIAHLQQIVSQILKENNVTETTSLHY